METQNTLVQPAHNYIRTDIKKTSYIKRRLGAFIVDVVAASLPLIVCLLLINTMLPLKYDTDYILEYNGYAYFAPLLYESPALGVVSMLDVPLKTITIMDTTVNTSGGRTVASNYSMGATAMGLFAFLTPVYFLAYGAICTCLYDGSSVGRRIFKLRVIADNGGKKPLIIREVVGKILLNSIPIIPLISVFTILFRKDGKAVHDIISKTSVIAVEDERPLFSGVINKKI